MIRVLEKLGYVQLRQKGSHVRLRCESHPHRRPTTVPLHHELKRGTLKGILRDADLTEQQFQDLR